MTRPFLSVVTRVYRRPKMLLANLESVARQTCDDYEQVLLVDEQGQGMHWANGQLFRNRHRVRGQYVFILDDDDLLTEPDAFSMFKDAASDNPDVILCRFYVAGHGIVPDVWPPVDLPAYAHICTSNMVVRWDVWQDHIRAFDKPVGGDHAFLASMWHDFSYIEMVDAVVGQTQRISRGNAE